MWHCNRRHQTSQCVLRFWRPLDREAADFAFGIAADSGTGGDREKLGAQADAEDRQAALEGLPEQTDFGIDPRMQSLIVNPHRATQ